MQLVELSESVCTEAATIAESFSAAYQSSFEAFVWSEGAWRAPQSFRLDPCILAHLANVAPTDPSHTKSTAEGTGLEKTATRIFRCGHIVPPDCVDTVTRVALRSSPCATDPLQSDCIIAWTLKISQQSTLTKGFFCKYLHKV